MKLSVLVITYNQDRYIAQALDSILMQIVDFDYEIIIGDDCSSDGTISILEKYRAAYPRRIKLLLSQINRGATQNFAATLSACHGTYVAMLEGDDYWTSEDKLQRQIDSLDSHPNYVACFTNSVVIDNQGSVVREERVMQEQQRDLEQVDIVSGCYVPTNTLVFRRALLVQLPSKIHDVVNADLILCSVLAEHGAIGFLDKSTAAYRIHSGSLWSSKPPEYIMSNNIKTRKALMEIFGDKYRELLLPIIYSYSSNLISSYVDQGRIINCIYSSLSLLLYRWKHGQIDFCADLMRIFKNLKQTTKNKFIMQNFINPGN